MGSCRKCKKDCDGSCSKSDSYSSSKSETSSKDNCSYSKLVGDSHSSSDCGRCGKCNKCRSESDKSRSESCGGRKCGECNECQVRCESSESESCSDRKCGKCTRCRSSSKESSSETSHSKSCSKSSSESCEKCESCVNYKHLLKDESRDCEKHHSSSDTSKSSKTLSSSSTDKSHTRHHDDEKKDEKTLVKKFQITFIDKKHHPQARFITDSDKAICVNGHCGATIHLYSGVPAEFEVLGSEDCQFRITDNQFGAPALPETNSAKFGTLTTGKRIITADNTKERILFYDNPKHRGQGGVIIVHYKGERTHRE